MILDLCLMIDCYNQPYRQRTLNVLSEGLGPGFHHLTFLTIDNSDKLGNPVGINKVQHTCDSYINIYHRHDMFSHLCNPKKPIVGVMSVEDIMSFREYERTSYYNDFLRKENLYYQLAVPLYFNNRLIGGLGCFREKQEENFTPRDKEVMDLLSRHLALSYHNSIKTQRLMSTERILAKGNHENDIISQLTSTEREIVRLVAKGMTNRDIAKYKHISFHTVKSHLEHIYNKLDVSSRTEMLHRIYGKRVGLRDIAENFG